MDDQTESHLPLCKVPDEGEFKQDDLCKAYIEIMRKMSEIPVNADPRTVAFIFGRPVRDVNESVSLRPIMVSASLLSIDSFAPVSFGKGAKTLQSKEMPNVVSIPGIWTRDDKDSLAVH